MNISMFSTSENIIDCNLMPEMRVFDEKSDDECKYSTAFGYDWNPPFEGHFWLESVKDKNIIFDPSLPGVILRGRCTGDELGMFIQKREPIIFLGVAPEWLIYKKATNKKDTQCLM